ncbi:5'-methylthioadenosine/S-adenosylhomocysteine nucleosidase family protein [Aspergillus aculeatinus CBS 121060]|uniref:Purine and uridine phosphorylase n=1 Tax=Aspergillus aculeatinus CBS 121060 TaxID=1448322 RepID=A0ACD1H4H5_9EURO|nr:purine and uridine phosphorylase [Aspergillus aculeatinus CBS 121060]RAH68316.1 purine and uridine phosphorylase [Aspergillus aculeatinus CBS 121060]
MSSEHVSLRHEDYTIACICPMGVDRALIEAMLDDIHCSLPMPHHIGNHILGRMDQHKVAISHLSKAGNNSAASGAVQLLNDFPRLQFIILTGIGSGIPDLARHVDIRLGDVVVSKPTGVLSGVVQFDRGKILAGDRFERTGALHLPPNGLLATVARLEARHRRVKSEMPRYLEGMLPDDDRLFRTEASHALGGGCGGCDPAGIVVRSSREDTSPVVHYGTIGSADVAIEDGQLRDQLRDELGILGVNIEAAGVAATVSCLVIHGVCDYADSHKNKRWQPYAAATAAAYMKELVSVIPVSETNMCARIATAGMHEGAA